jgi:hypothetical protein
MLTAFRVQFGTVFVGVIVLICPDGASGGKPPSRFAGSYTGKYTFHRMNSDDPQEGITTYTIDDKGNISGDATNLTQNQSLKVTGTVDDDGRVRMIYEFPMVTYTGTGTYSRTRKGTIIGTLIQWSGMRPVGMIQLELTPK